jgi:hypothetical protein
MKKSRIMIALIVTAGIATAQSIRWNPIGENAPAPMEAFKPFNIKPLSPPSTTYNQIGPLTYGSDGSRAYSTQDSTITRMPNGDLVPDLVYIRGNDGQMKRCKKYGENMFCE